MTENVLILQFLLCLRLLFLHYEIHANQITAVIRDLCIEANTHLGEDVLAAFQGNHMIVAQPLAYLQSQSELSSLDRAAYVKLYGERNATGRKLGEAKKRLKKAEEGKQQNEAAELQTEVDLLTQQYKQLGEDLKACVKWRSKCGCPFSLVLADGLVAAAISCSMTDALNTPLP